ncbi:peptidoglycan-binding protein [Spirulina subsalsa FACHB-351]|uniref:Peptidoglycan-binding protein n=1 Tax=Spirulina subsalsa FACHB-351 TaxID=234711 RepID=A0ABT3L363_9CYAN|nr:peptidoglycan-binding domain-containing protein [Spirulina subsalsa]MCW6035425.1 peptidoglycan-binding protein [Spirulina subsalsa FACHB-351]
MQPHNFPSNPSSVGPALGHDRFAPLMAQNTLEEALEPQYRPEVAPHTILENYGGMILLSLLMLLLMVFLLLKRQVRELRFGIVTTLLIGIALPIILTVQITTDLLEGASRVAEESNGLEGGTVQEVDSSPLEAEETTPEPEIEEASQEDEEIVVEETEEATESPSPVTQAPTTPSNGAVSAPLGTPSTASSDDGTLGATRTESESPRRTPPPTPSLGERATPTRTPPPRADSALSPSPRRSSSVGGTDFRRPMGDELRRQGILVRRGDRTSQVELIQRALTILGFYDDEIDGYFGPRTEIAVKQFQIRNNLLPDGIVGFSTCKVLQAQVPDLNIQCVSN